ncbi:MAG: adenylate/guanylate cyclase domain-containing protein [Candidatus Aureabacteria bacterium]|nr:adenylate/guanylate cyclase domain-containing protein [Candidatus Auribacterota bacterium]
MNVKHPHNLIAVAGMFITAVVLLMYCSSTEEALFKRIENQFIDLKYRLRGPRDPGEDTCIVVIDEKSVAKLGRWPWKRSVIAKVIELVKKDGAAVVGLDILYTEPATKMDKIDVLNAIRTLKQADQEQEANKTFFDAILDEDAYLSGVIEECGNVILPVYFCMEGQRALCRDYLRGDELSVLKKFSYKEFGDGEKEKRYPPIMAPGLAKTIPAIEKSVAGEGFVNVLTDSDGCLRWEIMAIKYEDSVYMPLGMQVAAKFKALKTEDIKLNFSEGIAFGNVNIPLDRKNRMLINYYGGNETFRYYSFFDVYIGAFQRGSFKDKIVLFGAVDPGIGDDYVTPLSRVLPGVEKHANVIANILNNDFLRKPRNSDVITGILIVLFGFSISIAARRMSVFQLTLFPVVIIIVFLFASQVFFSRLNILVEAVYPLLSIFLAYGVVIAMTLYSENREKKRIRKVFGQYASRELVREILADPSKLKLGGEKRVLTVMFSDVANFTPLCENMEPEKIVSILNVYLSKMAEVIYKNGGIVDKFLGDGIMCVFGAPVYRDDHAVRACRTALDMIEEVKKINEFWKKETGRDIHIRIGINSGDMVVGNLGSLEIMDYTEVGDNVNLAARLEATNKEYGTSIIISKNTYNLVKDQVDVRELGAVRVKGKEKEIEIYELKAVK